MQVGAASSQLTGGVNQHPIRTANDAHQLTFRQDGAAPDTGPLGNMLHALNNLFGHLRYKTSASMVGPR